MNYKTPIELIIGKLSGYLKVNILPYKDKRELIEESNYETMPQTFVEYELKFNNKLKGNYNLITKTIPSKDERFEHDIQYIRQEQPQIIISFTCYSNDNLQAMDIIGDIQSWFEFEGKLFLTDHNIVTIKSTTIEDSIIQCLDNYKIKKRLDVTVRYTIERELDINTIETVNLSISRKI